MNVPVKPEALKPRDFASDQEVRWCPGCVDYAILCAVQNALADIGAKKEKTVFVSGIGCAERFSYYLSTYGFHTIRGRAPRSPQGSRLLIRSLMSGLCLVTAILQEIEPHLEAREM